MQCLYGQIMIMWHGQVTWLDSVLWIEDTIWNLLLMEHKTSVLIDDIAVYWPVLELTGKISKIIYRTFLIYLCFYRTAPMFLTFVCIEQKSRVKSEWLLNPFSSEILADFHMENSLIRPICKQKLIKKIQSDPTIYFIVVSLPIWNCLFKKWGFLSVNVLLWQ